MASVVVPAPKKIKPYNLTSSSIRDTKIDEVFKGKDEKELRVIVDDHLSVDLNPVTRKVEYIEFYASAPDDEPLMYDGHALLKSHDDEYLAEEVHSLQEVSLEEDVAILLKYSHCLRSFDGMTYCFPKINIVRWWGGDDAQGLSVYQKGYYDKFYETQKKQDISRMINNDSTFTIGTTVQLKDNLF